jgi:hypothetical protein
MNQGEKADACSLDDAHALIDYYTTLRPAHEYDGRSPAIWYATIDDEHTGTPKLIALQLTIGVQLSERCCFCYHPEFTIEDVTWITETISARLPAATAAELQQRLEAKRQRSREWAARHRRPKQRPHQL